MPPRSKTRGKRGTEPAVQSAESVFGSDIRNATGQLIVPSYHRQLGIVTPAELGKYPITMIGAGGIGSPTILALAKMGVPNLTLIDSDNVEVHNMPNQMVRLKDLGRPKVEALAEIVHEFSGTHIIARPEMFTNQSLSGIVISGVHTMTSRRAIWQAVKYNVNVPLYIDGRMGGQIMKIFTVNPTDPDQVRKYENHLPTDEHVVDLPCTARAIIYNTFVLAGLIANQVKKFIKNEPLEFNITFDLVTMMIVNLV